MNPEHRMSAADQATADRTTEEPGPDFHIDYSDPEPVLRSPYSDDPVTARATGSLTVGSRTLLSVSDGYFLVDLVPDFLGSPAAPHGFVDQVSADGDTPARMPVGAFVWTGNKTVLIDAGFGPRSGAGILVGGELRRNLAGFGLTFADIDAVAITHLHPDHTGWLADTAGTPLFENAQIFLGAKDWEYFIVEERGTIPVDPHIRAGLLALADKDRVTLLDGEAVIGDGLVRLDGSGHTPGHSLYMVEDGGERAIVFGDAMYCPQQLTETDWVAASDIDPVLAQRTRERYLRELDDNGGLALGCHFPGLKAGRVLSGAWETA